MQKLHEKFIVDESGKKTAVVLSMAQFDELLQDLHDLAVVAERKAEPTMSTHELMSKLKADGLL